MSHASKRDFPNLLEVDIEQFFRFGLRFGLVCFPRADAALAVRSVRAVKAAGGVVS